MNATPRAPRGFPKQGTLGQQIKWARRNVGLSHDTLAAKVGSSRQHLIRLEKGLHVPREPLMRAIAEATGVPVETFAWSSDDEEDSSVQELAAVLLRVIRKERVAV